MPSPPGESATTHPDTRLRLLDAAERLFADFGLDGTSVRTITAAAEANLGAVNYHFGSKEGLIEAVFARRIGPINEERLRLLDRVEAEAGANGPPLEAVVEAFIAPALRARDIRGRGGLVVMRLLGHALSQTDERVRRMFTSQFREVIRRFLAAFRRAQPDLTEQAIFWRLLFMAGAMVHTMVLSSELPEISGGLCSVDDPERVIRRLVHFLSAGMRMPEVGIGVQH